jgi:phosphotransferase system HPr (HPr) family protein
MSLTPESRSVTVVNPEGLHFRAATQIRTIVLRYRAQVELIKGQEKVDATSVLQMLTLCAARNDTLLLEASGDDAAAVLDALARLFANSFDHE